MSVSRKETAGQETKEILSEEEQEDGNRAKEEFFEEVMRESALSTVSKRKRGPSKQQIIPTIPEAVGDFLRNFLRRAGLSQTLRSFEAEWYGSAQGVQTETLRSTGVFFIPDAHTHRQLLQSELESVYRELDLLRQEVLVAGDSLVRMQRERDFHWLQYRRVAEDKNILIQDFKKLKEHLESYQPALKQLEDKYQAALRQKMLLCLKEDRVQNTTEAKLNQEKSQIKIEKGMKKGSADKSPTKRTTSRHQKHDEVPRLADTHLAQLKSEEYKKPSSFSLLCSVRAHRLPISCIDLHPQEHILASASDDGSWRLWALPAHGEKVAQMVLTGEGSDWLSSCSFHPNGTRLATTSKDTTVRLWDFSRGCSVSSLCGHSQPTWGCSFHSCGNVLASCSADRTAKLWDLNSQSCCLTLRRHKASVNSICFLPFPNTLLTCSADRTIVMWDARLGVCTTAFNGHQHSCNHVTFSLPGNIMASCDSHGIINLWDIRKPVLPMATVDAGPLAANHVAFSPSGKMLAVASSDCLVRLVDVDSCTVSSLVGHGNAVQSVTFDHKGQNVMSAGSDGVINIWS